VNHGYYVIPGDQASGLLNRPKSIILTLTLVTEPYKPARISNFIISFLATTDEYPLL